jgi:hypothetical protein
MTRAGSRENSNVNMARFFYAALIIGTAWSLTGCSAAKTFQTEFHKSFRASFKDKFLSSCRQHAAGRPNAQLYCRCAEARVEAHYSDQELLQLSANQSAPQRQFLNTVVRDCALEAAGHK